MYMDKILSYNNCRNGDNIGYDSRTIVNDYNIHKTHA
jgi:hypothetical protein